VIVIDCRGSSGEGSRFNAVAGEAGRYITSIHQWTRD